MPRVAPQDPQAAWFEARYAAAGDDHASVPWAELAPRPSLVDWLDGHPGPRPGATALVVACGYGDDAEELARRGWQVRAFDVAPTAVEQCRARFPRSVVDYRVADLFALPSGWARNDLVVEIQTIQSLPMSRRTSAVAAVATAVGPGGELFLRAYGREDDEPVDDLPPRAVSRTDLSGFAAAGLEEVWFTDSREPDSFRTFHAAYRRPGCGS